MKILFLVLFALDVILHVYSCIPPIKHRIRKPTKVLLMPLLAASYIFIAQSLNPLIIIALLFGCTGDSFLLSPNKGRMFKLGIASFGVGHLLYIVFFLTHLTKQPPFWLILAGIAAYAAGIGLMMNLLAPKLPLDMRFPCAGYMVLLSLMSLSALLLAAGSAGAAGKLMFVGSLFFIVSDSILSLVTFRKNFRFSTLAIMISYILAQSLIAFGAAAAGA